LGVPPEGRVSAMLRDVAHTLEADSSEIESSRPVPHLEEIEFLRAP